jgi:peptidoglycan/LPS O-acetylase OafA/YrhL
MRRIMPAYWAAVACAFVAIAVFSGFRLQESPAVLVEHAGTWVMVGFPFQPGINGMDQEPVTAGVYWTLRVELLFYLVLPALAWFRRGWRPLLVILMALAVNVGLHHLPIPDLATDGAVLTMKQFTAAIVTGFSVGALAAYLPMFVQSDGWMQRWLCSRWAAGAATALLAVQFFLVRGTFSWQEPILLAPAFFMVVAGNGFCGVLTSRPVRCLGQISYSLYIFHGIVLFAVTSSVNLYYPIETMNVALYWSMMLATGVLVVALCTLSYWFVERPFFKGMARGVRASIAAKA